jgi:hypothetical protein
VVETWRWKTISFPAVSRYPGIFSSKKIFTQFSSYYGLRDAISLRLFYWVTRDYGDCASYPTDINSLFFEQISLRVHMISRSVSPTSLSNYARRESQMLPQQPTTYTAINHSHELIGRVLHLRRQLGIDLSLSVRDSEDILLSPSELQASSMETSKHTSPVYDRRDWLTWSQSPGEGNLPEQGQEKLF